MRRKLFIVSALVLSVFLAGCADDNNDVVDEDQNPPVEQNEDEGSNDSEEPAENDEDTDVADEEDATDEDAVEEDEALEEPELAWPADFMPHVPAFEGSIFKVNEKDETHMYVAFEEVSQEDAVEYVSVLKEAGFTKDADEYIADTVVNFKGFDKDGNFAKFRWSQNGYATVDMVLPESE